MAFALNNDDFSMTRVEIWGMIEGMELVRDNMASGKLAIQSDSTCAVKILHELNNWDHQHTGLVLHYRELLRHYWQVKLKLDHVFRESNYLANLGHSSCR
ncbi:hypothetical protein LINPERPRIM_LOCUS31961 [Linum perenne]